MGAGPVEFACPGWSSGSLSTAATWSAYVVLAGLAPANRVPSSNILCPIAPQVRAQTHARGASTKVPVLVPGKALWGAVGACNRLISLAPPGRLEHPTVDLEGRCSIQLSYGGFW
ncbi:MAG: hypothetical protein JWN04_980, partial [Myxococcaceae bacterium]|nr:hypothetical protein [Myxococcaceae bacterium]